MNLLLINADQLRHDCVGYRGIRPVKTPNLDKLAGEGCAYTRAFSPLPVCAPARQAILSGRHPDSFGAFWNYDMFSTPTVQPEWCWTKALPGRGYQTAYLGRFHVSPDRVPADFGYETHISWAGHKALLAEKYPNVAYKGGWFGEINPVPVCDSGTHWMADRACETIRSFAEAGKPWHIWVDYEEPHLPCRPSEPFASMYAPKDIAPWDGFDDAFIQKPYCHRQQMMNWELDGITWPEVAPMVARYYALISQLDDAIGRILDALDATGQANDTIVAFTSDHGDLCGAHRMLDKHYVLYDDTVRVPLIVRYPGEQPWICDSFVENSLDLPASFVKWFALDAPDVAHGRALPLSAASDTSPRRAVVSSANGQQFGFFNSRMLRDDRYKYVWNLTDIDELYDLQSDPGELCNLIADTAYAQRISDMRRLLRDELITHGDRFAASGWLEKQLLENKKHILRA